jgi:glycine/D-amino acid oxidase-like deaminating enzyme
MRRRRTLFVDSDILVVGGGVSGCGATYESRYWGRDLKIIYVGKANIERSGAVAQGLYAINCYMGMQWNENRPEDHVRYARNDLMGLVREDLGWYGRFARAADAIRFAMEELPPELLPGACLEVDEEIFDRDDILRLYESDEYPLVRRATTGERARKKRRHGDRSEGAQGPRR